MATMQQMDNMRHTGVVQWYDDRKGYGFLRCVSSVMYAR